MRTRITPSFIVAVLALIVALGGSAYAGALITSANIKNGTIQAVDIKKHTITSDRLARTCSKSQTKINGLCVDRKPSGPSVYQVAVVGCSARDGRLLGESEFLTLRSRILAHPAKFVWANGMANQYEFLSDFATSGVQLVPEATDLNLNNFGNASAQNFYYRCVTYP
ncbi:MAG: hypothetical protein KDB63_02550 [Nocardioidaceae bacterium]|nr:hypothetical protein [Nocardioidaceae bacterium]